MNAEKLMIQGNLALKPQIQEDSRLFVVQGGRPVVQGHAAPSRRSVVAVSIMLISALAILIGSTIAFQASTYEISNRVSYQTVKVFDGESLWSLAEEHPVDGLSTQETSDLIRSVNHLSRGSLDAGSYLKVPATH